MSTKENNGVVNGETQATEVKTSKRTKSVPHVETDDSAPEVVTTATEEVCSTEPSANCEGPVCEQDSRIEEAVEAVEAEVKKKSSNEHRIRYDYETGYVLLRVSSKTEPRKLGGAIVKHFKDGAKALVVSFIGVNTMSTALKGISVAQQFLPKETMERLVGKQLAIIPEFHEFDNENGTVNTMKFTLHLVNELK